MTGKDPKDMTASELLRWAANDEPNEYGNTTVSHKLFSALSGKPYGGTRYNEDARNIRALADKIDAEIEAARKDAVKESKKPMWWFRSAIQQGEDWPAPHDGEKFREYLKRCFIQRPLDEDGEPVQFGEDTDKLHGVEKFIFTRSGECCQMQDACGNMQNAFPGQRVKRHAPEVLLADGLPAKVGETVYRVDTGKGFEIARIAPMCPGDDEGKTLVLWGDDNEWRAAIDHTHTPPVLAADSLPMREGDTVWLTDEGARHAGDSDTLAEAGPYALCGIGANDRLTVKALPSLFHPNRVDLVEEGAWCSASWLTHEEPDTQERIDEDAQKPSYEYWRCASAACVDCPATIDGKKPHEHFDSLNCQQAQLLDMLRRQRELDARKGGE